VMQILVRVSFGWIGWSSTLHWVLIQVYCLVVTKQLNETRDDFVEHHPTLGCNSSVLFGCKICWSTTLHWVLIQVYCLVVTKQLNETRDYLTRFDSKTC
jgi:hypothetical protein